MIWIFRSDRASAGSCENYDELFQYILHKEELKLLEDRPEFGQPPWSFIFFTPQQVSAIYSHTKQPLLTAIVKEAHEKGMGFIEIFQGDFQNSIEILATPYINIEALKKQWCLEYCNAHHYIVIENLSHSNHSAQSQWRSQPLSSCASLFQKEIGALGKPSDFLLDDFVVRTMIPKVELETTYPLLVQGLLGQISPSQVLPKCSPDF